MISTNNRMALGLNLPFVNTKSPNYRPKTWPPSDNFPVVIDANGLVVSHYGDDIWDLSPWAGRSLRLNFVEYNRGRSKLSANSSKMAKLIAAWWLWGPRPVNNAGTLKSRFTHLLPIFKLCSEHDVNIESLYRHPDIVDKVASYFSSSHGEAALILLHNLFEQRSEFGHVILDRESLRRLSSAIPAHEGSQTAYIPPRIWLYQVNRLREFLNDYQKVSVGISNCYNECIALYEGKFGSLDALYTNGSDSRDLEGSGFVRNFGHFTDYAIKHGIYENLKKWIVGPNAPKEKCTISSLGSYMTLASKVGVAYLLNFSLMRIDEAWRLRSDCLKIEKDPQLGPIYTISGITTKTINDPDARWITSPSVALATSTLAHVAKLRTITASKRSGISIPLDQQSNPQHHLRQYEPWARGNGMDKQFTTRPSYSSYSSVLKSYPLLFSEDEIRINELDLEYARLLTPSLDNSYAIGKPWPFAWHQLRRTGSVNMQASGLVSDASLQYQLKHVTRAMSLYYGRGFSKVNLDSVAYSTYLKAMYEVLGKEITRLLSPRFVSPHGDIRKAQILKIVTTTEANKLASAAKKGAVSWRETLAGGCTKRGHCSLGGADTLVHCGGGHGKGACTDALYDQDRIPQLMELHDFIDDRLAEVPRGSPYHNSLELQRVAVINILDTLRISKNG
ncbi:hypothetical protein [Pseudomonas alkylphenolica]|uniref:hypothetical protein n=1 Tax=Pseudomonas alkylphenolica TaxID=237609 RepID=UPI0018D87D40|nr:hypothetical protein [Pseudomonas alkylphenolica]MBH3426875.1 hypothetical protein [Pseudomonas alkylphenolica]